MNQETRDTAIKMAEYSHNEVRVGKQKVISYLMLIFGIFIIVSAMTIFPNDSSWGSIYSIIGSIILVIGIYLFIKPVLAKRSLRILSIVGCVVLLFGFFTISDYLVVAQFKQVPRFSYVKSYSSKNPDEMVYKTLFFTAVQKDIGTKYERVEIVKEDMALQGDNDETVKDDVPTQVTDDEMVKNGALPQVADDEILFRIQMDVKEDIGLLLIDYGINGSESSGGISNADKSMVKHDDLLEWKLDKQQLDNLKLADREKLTVHFTVVTEYVEPNFEDIYPEEYTIPMDEISLKANLGKTYFITIHGDKTNGYQAVLEK